MQLSLKRIRLARTPLSQLNTSTQAGRREFNRRMRRAAADWGQAWQVQTGKPVNKPNALRNQIGRRQRRRWVAKEKAL